MRFRLLLWVSLVVPGCDAGATGADETESAAATGTGDDDSQEPETVVIPLVTPEGWSQAPEADPFPAHRPEEASCVDGFGPEDGTFEIRTDACTYASFVQPTLADIFEGDEVRLTLVHDPLWAEEPATAHLAVSLQGDVLLDETFEIPSPYAFVQQSWQAPREVPVGTSLHVHLHNHGYNSYRIVEIALVRRKAA